MHCCLSTQVDTVSQAPGKIFADPCSTTQGTQPQFFMHMRRGGRKTTARQLFVPQERFRLGLLSVLQGTFLLSAAALFTGLCYVTLFTLKGKQSQQSWLPHRFSPSYLLENTDCALSTNPKDMSTCGGMEQTQISS